MHKLTFSRFIILLEILALLASELIGELLPVVVGGWDGV